MGASVGNAIGLKYAGIKAPVIATIGDSTFFHAGVPPAVNAGWNQTPIIIAVLDNQITGMTGHQASPASPPSSPSTPTRLIRIEDMLRASGIDHVKVVDPYDLNESTSAFKEALARDGPSGIVLRRVCSLVAKRMGTVSGPLKVKSEKCTGCLTCIRTLSCPAMSVESGKIAIDPVTCTGCGMCSQVCPLDAVGGD